MKLRLLCKSLWAARGLILAASLCCVVASCTSEGPFLLVQFCLRNGGGEELKSELLIISRAEKLQFFDNSESVRENALHVGAAVPKQVISFRIEGPSGMGLTATNLGLGDNQVAVGFTDGRDSETARKFSETVMTVFKKRWEVEVVPKSKGARPLAKCAP